MERKPNVFRKQTLDRIAEPDQLTDYLCVSQPAVWLLLTAILTLLLGLLIWSGAGTVAVAANGDAVIEDGQARIMLADQEAYRIEKGMRVILGEEEAAITAVSTNEFGRTVGYAQFTESDGTYPVQIIVKAEHPLALLFGR